MAIKTVIENKKDLELKNTLKELYHYRELLWTLAYRDFRVRYSQTVLGFAWAVIEPLATAILLSIVFNRIAHAPTHSIQPILFGLSGMLCWNYFSNVVSQGTDSLIMAQNMIKKIYFPRIIIPLSKAIAALPDLLITIAFTLLFLLAYKPVLSPNVWLSPLFIILTILAASGLGIWLSALNIRFRDFKHIIPFLIRIGLFVTPIAYSTSDIPKTYKWVFFLNPMTGVIEALRWSLFDIPFPVHYFYISLTMIFVLLFSGFFYFNKMQKYIADII